MDELCYNMVMRRRVNWWRKVLVDLFVMLLLTVGATLINIQHLNSAEFAQSLMPAKLPDETPPVVKLKGKQELEIAKNTTYIDAGVEAYDLKSEVTIEKDGEVDATQEGDYTIKYTAKDEAGNTASVERHVKVFAPSGVIYLTFDDGPGIYTATLLDVLEKYNVKATFFVTGAGEDDLILREYEEGHAVALHTDSHNYAYVYRSVDNYFADLYRVQERVKNVTGQTTALIRFPGGSSNLVSKRYDGGIHIMSLLVEEVQKRGFVYFDWNVASGDTDGATTADEIYNNVTNNLKWGGNSVVLQHDTKGYSVDAVERIIQYGLENGFAFARLDSSAFAAHHNVNN